MQSHLWDFRKEENLARAILNQNVGLVYKCLHAGAPVNNGYVCGLTTINLAVSCGLPVSVMETLFLYGAEVLNDCVDPKQNTLQYALVRHSSAVVIAVLLEHGAKVLNETPCNLNGYNSLETALSSTYKEYILGVHSGDNRTAPKIDVLELLLKAGADASSICAPSWAYTGRFSEIALLLARHGASISREWFDIGRYVSSPAGLVWDEVSAPFVKYKATATEEIARHLPTAKSGAHLTEICMGYLESIEPLSNVQTWS
jgi:hypothetical protein